MKNKYLKRPSELDSNYYNKLPIKTKQFIYHVFMMYADLSKWHDIELDMSDLYDAKVVLNNILQHFRAWNKSGNSFLEYNDENNNIYYRVKTFNIMI